MDPKPNTHRNAVLEALFVTLLWATSWVLIKIGLGNIPALTFAGLRYTLAFLILLAVFLRRGGWKQIRALRRGEWLQLGVYGLIYYTLTQGSQFVALASLPAITVSLLLSFSSVLIPVLGMFLLGERPSLVQWVGVGLSVAGTVIYFYPVNIPAAQTVGWIAALVGLAANSLSAIVGRSINQRGNLSALNVTVTSMGIGSLVMLAVGAGTQGLPVLSWQSWLIVIWLAAVNTALAFTLWNRVLRILPVAESSVINNSLMVQIPIMAVIFLGETLTGQQLGGMAVNVLGVLAVQLGRKK